MAQSITSFWYAIYKKLWAVGVSGAGHYNDQFAWGGFSLRSSGEPNGIFGKCSAGPYLNQMPLTPNDYTADNNGLYAMLKHSFDNPLPPNNTFTLGNDTWLVMPYPPDNPPQQWKGWNAPVNDPLSNPDSLIGKLKEWIETNMKGDDTPKGQYLDFSFVGTPPPAFPLKPNEDAVILFVASYPQDNGVRPGNVPAHYWNSSLIYVTSQAGVDQGLPTFGKDEEYYIAAVIGNSGDLQTGSAINQKTITIRARAYVFSTFLSPGFDLPSLGNLSLADPNTTYEQYFMPKQSRDVVGFRFNVDAVYQGLYDQVKQFTPQQLGFKSPDEWLKDGHACVKVWITGGEFPSAYNGQGADWPDDSAIPSSERRIAQRNLAAFDVSVMAAKKIHWQDFMMSQAGAGMNALKIEAELPGHAVRYYFAVPSEMYRRYVAKGGSHRGFEPVKEPPSKPFPDAVILRQTTPGARLEIAEHARERFFGMSLGVEIDLAALGRSRATDISVAHMTRDARVVGGFTLRGTNQRRKT